MSVPLTNTNEFCVRRSILPPSDDLKNYSGEWSASDFSSSFRWATMIATCFLKKTIFFWFSICCFFCSATSDIIVLSSEHFSHVWSSFSPPSSQFSERLSQQTSSCCFFSSAISDIRVLSSEHFSHVWSSFSTSSSQFSEWLSRRTTSCRFFSSATSDIRVLRSQHFSHSSSLDPSCNKNSLVLHFVFYIQFTITLTVKAFNKYRSRAEQKITIPSQMNVMRCW